MEYIVISIFVVLLYFWILMSFDIIQKSTDKFRNFLKYVLGNLSAIAGVILLIVYLIFCVNNTTMNVQIDDNIYIIKSSDWKFENIFTKDTNIIE